MIGCEKSIDSTGTPLLMIEGAVVYASVSSPWDSSPQIIRMLLAIKPTEDIYNTKSLEAFSDTT